MIQNLEIKAFLMFHNLLLEIIETGGKLDLSPQSHRALMRFFERIGVADVKEATTYEKRLSEHLKFQNRGTRGGYEFTHGVKWVDSKDFQAFLTDYWNMQSFVEHYFEGFNTRSDLYWLADLKKSILGNVQYNPHPKKQGNGTYTFPDISLDPPFSYEDFIFLEFQPEKNTWHGLNIVWLARAIHESLRRLVIQRDFELRMCALTGCQRVFVPSHTNRERHRFCSTSHRVLAHRKQEEHDRR